MFRKRGESAWLTQFIGPNATKSSAVFRGLFRLLWAMFQRAYNDLIEGQKDVWSTAVDILGRSGIARDVKVLVCLRPTWKSTFPTGSCV